MASLFVRYLYKSFFIALGVMLVFQLLLSSSSLTRDLGDGEKAVIQLLPFLVWFLICFLLSQRQNDDGYHAGNSRPVSGIASPVKEESKPLSTAHVNNILRRLFYGRSHLVVFDNNGVLMESFKEHAITSEHYTSVCERIHFATTTSQLEFLLNNELKSRLKIIISITSENNVSVWKEVTPYQLFSHS